MSIELCSSCGDLVDTDDDPECYIGDTCICERCRDPFTKGSRMSIVIIHGPQASGKTRNKTAFRKHFKCRRILDGWDGAQPLRTGTLALTNEEPPFRIPGATVLDVASAIALIKK